MTNLRKILEEHIHHLVARKAPHGFKVEEDKKLTKEDIDLAHQQILELIPKKKYSSGFDKKSYNQGFNQAISEMEQSMTGER